MRNVVVFLFCLGLSFSVRGQSCDCPTAGNCNTCAGGITTLTLRFTGITPQTVSASDGGGVVFSQTVNPNTTFTFGGSLPNDKFVGSNVTLTVGGTLNATIPSNCGTVFVGNVYGLFTIAAANSKTGGLLCCSVANTDATPPVISGCPSNIVVNLPANACTVAGGWTAPTATDNCGTPTITPNILPTAPLSVGVTTITYVATDNYSNTSTCSFTVTVADNIKPTISNCPANISIEATSECEAAVSWVEPTATDNCSQVLTKTHSPGSIFPFGTTIVTYTSTDPSGNKETCSFSVTVKDTTQPVISDCPGDITLEAISGCQAIVSWTAPNVADNCLATLTSTHTPGTSFAVGTTSVTYTATDPSGNASTCTFNVIVTSSSPPAITGCPGDITLTTDGCVAIASWTPPTASSNCDAVLQVNHIPGAEFPIGATVVTYTATDGTGRTSTCSFNVTVKTNRAPTITGCPEDIEVHTYNDDEVVTWDPPAATAVCGTLSTTTSNEPGSRFSPGEYTIVYDFSDGTGNKTSCSFNLNVIKDEVEFGIQKAVTPNGDGANDYWELADIEKFDDNSVTVVDRWGNKIYQASGYDNRNVFWNGIGPNGNRVPVGTYFYTIEVRVNGSQVRKTGFIEVIY